MSEFIIECEYDFDDGWIPGEHREKIVRCRDCKHWMDYEHEFEPNLGYCREFDREEVRDNDFCSFGEKRNI